MTEQSPEAEIPQVETPEDSSETATAVEEKPVYGDISIEDLDTPEYSQEQFDDLMAMYDDSFSGIKEGEIVKGRVVGTTPGEVLVDIGFKSEGAIPLKEFGDAPESIEIGAEVEVYTAPAVQPLLFQQITQRRLARSRRPKQQQG